MQLKKTQSIARSKVVSIHPKKVVITVSDSLIFITEQQLFDQLCQQLQAADVVALDTEFIREKTFFPIFALLQISSPCLESVFLIDIPQIPNLSAFKTVLQSDTLITLVHGCSEDLEIFLNTWGCLPTHLFDTQVAQALTGDRPQTGYTKLVQQRCGIELESGQTRSNWLQRPLSQQQQHYAANDVRYLYDLYCQLNQELVQQQRHDWLTEEMTHLKNKLLRQKQYSRFEQGYVKIHNHWLLKPQALTRLSVLYGWRERQARACDLPRKTIVSDEALYQIAQSPSRPAITQLVVQHKMTQQQFDAYSSAILDCLQALADTDLLEGQVLAVKRPLPKPLRPLLKVLKSTVQQQAQAYDLHPDVLLTSRQITLLLRMAEENKAWGHQLTAIEELDLPAWATGWRQQVCVEPILQRALQWFKQNKV